MLVRFGYVAMSLSVKNASPSKTMTLTRFNQIDDREAAIRKLENIAKQNLHNTLRLLYYNYAHRIQIYRFSSRLIPLIGHVSLQDWDPVPRLAESFRKIGDYVNKHEMRVSFHPDHFTVLSTPREEVLKNSKADLMRHVEWMEQMGLDERAKCNIHIGGAYGNKEAAMERFITNFKTLAPNVQRRLTLENDDKTFHASETLSVCEALNVPMVLDVHHHAVNPDGNAAEALWPKILKTWQTSNEFIGLELAPKIHVSSPKSESDPRGHADDVDPLPLYKFLQEIAPITKQLDVMIEAKRKDAALFKLVDQLAAMDRVSRESETSLLFTP